MGDKILGFLAVFVGFSLFFAFQEWEFSGSLLKLFLYTIWTYKLPVASVQFPISMTPHTRNYGSLRRVCGAPCPGTVAACQGSASFHGLPPFYIKTQKNMKKLYRLSSIPINAVLMPGILMPGIRIPGS
ncbi:MAG: hypothetical protein LBK63_02870 [Treponema sp.]|nr:hypothetical protein [Treponema sp.]